MTKRTCLTMTPAKGGGLPGPAAPGGSNVPVAITRANDDSGDGDVSGRDEGTRRVTGQAARGGGNSEYDDSI